MADVTDSVIARLISMDGYEQMLEIDRVTVEYGVTEGELMRLMDTARGASPVSMDPIFEESLSRSKSVDYDLEPTRPLPTNQKHWIMLIDFEWGMIQVKVEEHVNLKLNKQ